MDNGVEVDNGKDGHRNRQVRPGDVVTHGGGCRGSC